MSRHNKAISVTFNDNDGDMGWLVNPESAYDLKMHYARYGKWKTRWIILKRVLEALRWLENYSKQVKYP